MNHTSDSTCHEGRSHEAIVEEETERGRTTVGIILSASARPSGNEGFEASEAQASIAEGAEGGESAEAV